MDIPLLNLGGTLPGLLSPEDPEFVPVPSPGAVIRDGADIGPQVIEILPTIAEQLNTVFNELPLELKIQFYSLKATLKTALEQGDNDVAIALIQAVTPPNGYEAIKDTLLNILS